MGGAFVEVGDCAALSRRFCVDFVLPRPNACRLDTPQELAGCRGLNRDVVLTAHLVMTPSRSGEENVGLRDSGTLATYALEKNEVMLAVL